MSSIDKEPMPDYAESLRKRAAIAVSHANLGTECISAAGHSAITQLQREAGQAAIEANLRTPSLMPIPTDL